MTKVESAKENKKKSYEFQLSSQQAGPVRKLGPADASAKCTAIIITASGNN